MSVGDRNATAGSDARSAGSSPNCESRRTDTRHRNHGTDRSDSRHLANIPAGTVLLGVVLVVAVCFAAFLSVSGAGVASGTALQNETVAQNGTAGNDTGPPVLHSGERINGTAVALLFVDDTGVDTSSIDAEDFLLSDGELDGVAVTANGSNATATLRLAEPIDADELTVGLRPGSDIRDVDGNRMDTESGTVSVTVSGMDGIPPRILGTNVTDATGGPARLGFNFDEVLREIRVEIRGPVNATLDINDFENPQGNEYVATYDPPADGTYTVELVSATDTTGNTESVGLVRTITASRKTPRTVIGIDFSASEGRNVTFDASQSANNVANFTWEFGDGETATGERVTHEFDPGIYTITLEATDENGNVGRDTLELNLTTGIDGAPLDPGGENGTTETEVRVDRPGSSPTTDAMVRVFNARAGTPLSVGATDGTGDPIVVGNSVTLDGLSVTTVANGSFTLALSATGAGAVADAGETGVDPIAGLTVINDVGDDDLETVELVFSVPARELDGRGLEPSAIQLRRATAGSWEPLETTFLDETAEGYRFEATAPGFSRFAVVGLDDQNGDSDGSGNGNDGGDGDQDDGQAAFEVTDATVNETTVQAGDAVRVDGTVRNTGDAAGDFEAGLTLNGTVVGTRAVGGVQPGGTATVTFTPRLDDPGTVEVAVDGTSAGTVVVEPQAESGGNDSDGTDDGEGGNGSDGNGSDAGDTGVFEVTVVTLNTTSVGPGDAVEVTANVENRGEQRRDFLAALEVNGTVVRTQPVPQIPGDGENLNVSFVQRFNETGAYNVSVNGTESAEPVTVESGGGLLGFLGFLPLGILRTLLLFVGVPLAVVYIVLKAIAFYLGY